MSQGLSNEGFSASMDDHVELKVDDKWLNSELVNYTWRNLNVWTAGGTQPKVQKGATQLSDPPKQKQKHILSNVSGEVRSGELLAIIGASGAGKSTLMDVLTFRSSRKLGVSGDRAVNGVSMKQLKGISSISGYVQQADLFIATLTVQEHLVFQALLCMDKDIPYKARLNRVQEVMLEFGLAKCANVQIGFAGRSTGISGGERKRLAFASEVLNDPPLLFCDEPTSGLDSFAAQSIVSVMESLAAKGKAVLCIIHQPSSRLFQMFNRLLILAEGRVAFSGQTAKAKEFFQSVGYPCSVDYNPSDFFIETLAIQPGREAECRVRVHALCDAFRDSQQFNHSHSQESTDKEVPVVTSFRDEESSSLYKASWWSQFRAVLWRSWVSSTKNPMFVRVKLIQTLVISAIVGLIFFGQEFDQAGVQNINGAMFLLMWYLTFANSFGTIGVFCLEFPIFMREHLNGMYRSDVYFLSKMVAEFPFYVFFPTLLMAIVYFMIGLQPDASKFFITVGIYVLIANCAVSLGYLVSCFTADVTIALAIAPGLIVPLLLFGGIFLNTGSIPVWLDWVKYLSWFYWGNEAAVVTQWKDVESIRCTVENSTCPANGSVVLKSLDFSEDNFTVDIVALFALVVGFRLLAYLVLLIKIYRK